MENLIKKRLQFSTHLCAMGWIFFQINIAALLILGQSDLQAYI